MVKVPHARLSLEVEKLYAKTFPEGTDPKVIEDHCDTIRALIESSGWDTTEFIFYKPGMN